MASHIDIRPLPSLSSYLPWSNTSKGGSGGTPNTSKRVALIQSGQRAHSRLGQEVVQFPYHQDLTADICLPGNVGLVDAKLDVPVPWPAELDWQGQRSAIVMTARGTMLHTAESSGID